MNRCRFLSFVAAALLAGSTRVCAAPAPTPVPHGKAQAAARGKQLRQEIKILEARMRAAQPEFEREQHAWEGDVLQRSGTAEKSREVPARILAILALEPTEREPAQREEVAAYFRPRSKTLGGLWKQLAAKRAALPAGAGGK